MCNGYAVWSGVPQMKPGYASSSGRRPAPPTSPPARLPAARVVSAPDAAPTAPTIEPLAGAAPARPTEPLGDAPRLLRDRDPAE